MVICAENIDSLIETARYKFVVMVRDIGNYISIQPVAAAQYEILIHTVIGSLEPDRAVLLVSVSRSKKLVYDSLCFIFFVNGTLSEPVIVYDPVFFQIAFQSCYINRKGVAYQSISAFLFRSGSKLAAVYVIIIFGVFDNIHAEINVLRHFKFHTFSAEIVDILEKLLVIVVFFHRSFTCFAAKLHKAEI